MSSPRDRPGPVDAPDAAELFLSAHTVRDYIKSVFEKIGVASRSELVAKLFAEFYEGPHMAAAAELKIG